jgi:tetratricopeptide (TPR) repeat protein
MIEKLKDQARRHEQREEWTKALTLYLEAIEITDDSDEPDISLFNRVGDLQIRVGDRDGAVATYERAIDHYMAADLPNNAIAICQKIIRNTPGRANVFLRMGQIRAEQGFAVDARQNFLTYAEMKQARGDTEEAFRALGEYVRRVPGDAETRLFLAEQIAAREDVDGALPHFQAAYHQLVRDGNEERAAHVRSRLEELAPGVPIPAEPVFEEDAVGAGGELAGFESTAMDDAGGFGPDPDEEPEAQREPAEPEAAEVGDLGEFTDFGDEEEAEPLPTLGPEGGDEEEGFGDLEFSGFEDEAPDADDEEVAAAAHDPLGGALEEAVEEARAEQAAGPVDRLREELRREPDRLDLHQRLVEHAHETNDQELLISAFLDLAGALVRTGAPERARTVYRQVLDLDPQNRGALEGLRSEAIPEEERGEYVDLGSLVMDEEKEATTRWKVQAEAPSGDEAADFARMLSQFKDKVAENVATDDYTARYDLGAAYKDMGLLDEAITEFQGALRADASSLAALEMLGQCFLEKGEPAAAIRTLQRALSLPHDVEDDLLGIYYYLGQSHEEAGDAADAKEFYEKVFSLDINFKDVTERLRALR